MIWQMEKIKGTRKYRYWIATWRQNKKLHHEQIGSSKKLSEDEALTIARERKVEAIQRDL